MLAGVESNHLTGKCRRIEDEPHGATNLIDTNGSLQRSCVDLSLKLVSALTAAWQSRARPNRVHPNPWRKCHRGGLGKSPKGLLC